MARPKPFAWLRPSKSSATTWTHLPRQNDGADMGRSMLRPYEEGCGKTQGLRSFVAKSAPQDDSPFGFEAEPYRRKPVLGGKTKWREPSPSRDSGRAKRSVTTQNHVPRHNDGADKGSSMLRLYEEGCSKTPRLRSFAAKGTCLRCARPGRMARVFPFPDAACYLPVIRRNSTLVRE